MKQNDVIKPLSPDQSWLESYFCESLKGSKAYQIDTPKVSIKLDQNESPWDWPAHFKKVILNRVQAKPWNRYPEPYGDKLHELVAAYAGVPSSCVVTGPGSNFLIGLILDAMTKNIQGKVVVARPSFSLFEMHCRYAGIDYETWDLDENLDYSLDKLPNLPEGSLVVFASPNNPTGNALSKADFETLLQKYPKTMFFADEAYFEFNDEPYIDLLKSYANLLILRTFSKTMGAAGVRLGYVIGSQELIAQFSKLRLPYLINHFGMQAAEVILTEPEMQAFVEANVKNVRQERELMFKGLQEQADANGFWVKNSAANFVLLRFKDQDRCNAYYQHLIKEDILIRNISSGPGLAGCLRVSIGTPEENLALLAASAKFK